jgi:alkylhydroperoxidase family enzyme
MVTPRHSLPLRSSSSTSGDVQGILEKLEAAHRDIPIVRLVANWAPGFRPFIQMADALLTKGVLPPVTRELCVLHIAARRGLDYEWKEHVAISNAAGVSDRQRELLLDNWIDDGEVFSDGQRLALHVITEILEDGTINAETWDQAVDELGIDEAIELVFVYAWWGGFAAVATEVLLPLSNP